MKTATLIVANRVREIILFRIMTSPDSDFFCLARLWDAPEGHKYRPAFAYRRETYSQRSKNNYVEEERKNILSGRAGTESAGDAAVANRTDLLDQLLRNVGTVSEYRTFGQNSPIPSKVMISVSFGVATKIHEMSATQFIGVWFECERLP